MTLHFPVLPVIRVIQISKENNFAPMYTFDCTIVTDHRWLDESNADWYARQVWVEDAAVREALERRGWKVHRTNWDDASFNWSTTRYAMIRSTWDYFHRFDEFFSWLEASSAKTTFINNISLIRENIDKHYLLKLAGKGVPIPPTLFIEPGDARSLIEIARLSGWSEIVLKPAVSGAGRHTYRFLPDDASKHENIFRELIAKESMLIQEFQHRIMDAGEVSLMVMGGQFTHAVMKKAKAGDYRVQDDFGGTLHHFEPDNSLIAFAEQIVAACDPMPAFARVDIIRNNADEPVLSELELIEPELWFRHHPAAADVLAEYVVGMDQPDAKK